MEFPRLKEAEGKLAAKQKELHGIFAEAGPDMDMGKVKSLPGDSAAKVAEIRSRNEELDDLGKQVEELKSLYDIAGRVQSQRREDAGHGEAGAEQGDTGSGRKAFKSFGDSFVESKAYKGRAPGSVGEVATIEVELKTLMETGAGWAPETTRTGKVVEYATRPIQVTDIIPHTTTSQAAVVYMEETTFTNAAAETAEAGTYPESALALTERSVTVRKIATWLPVTDEQLEDEPQARGYINNRLPFMLRQRLDGQILTGDGSAPNLRGLLNVSGIQTQAKGADPIPDAVYKAMTKIRVTGRATPTAAVFHPNDWQEVRLLRTTDGIYIWGSPTETGPERIWGLRVVQADGITENTGAVGDFANFSELAVRRGVDVQVTNAHSDFFIKGKQAIRADLRAALVFYRPAAFCTVTGL
ncbi:phage major capsid protein [Pilimelia terevasa]|nr:phage major capsid protein [Pilimelia terevasa]